MLLGMQGNSFLLSSQTQRVILGWTRPFLAGSALQLLLMSVHRVCAEPWQPCVSPRGFAGTNEHPPCCAPRCRGGKPRYPGRWMRWRVPRDPVAEPGSRSGCLGYRGAWGDAFVPKSVVDLGDSSPTTLLQHPGGLLVLCIPHVAPVNAPSSLYKAIKTAATHKN